MATLTPWQKEEKEEKMKKLSQFLKVYISETPSTIVWQFAMWGIEGGGHLYSKNHPVS